MRLEKGDKEIIFREKLRVRDGRVHFVLMRLKSSFKVDIRYVTAQGHYTKKGVCIYLEYAEKLPGVLRRLAKIVKEYVADQ